MIEDLSDRASRGVALAALTVACVLFGPTPQVLRAMERIYAVAIHEDDRRDRRRRPPTRPRGSRPPAGRPDPSRP